MYNYVLKIFGFLKNAAYFFKVLSILFLLLHLLYWIQNLISAHFGWLQIFVPIFDLFNYISASICDKSFDLWGVIFEFKYIIAVIIYIILFYIGNLMISCLNFLENKYEEVCRFAQKTEERLYNNALKQEQEKVESKLNQYKIFISTSLKKKFSHPELGYNLEEHTQKVKKFLMEKTGVVPIEYNGGFVYSFNNFSKVDYILTIFFKLIKSNSPLDFVICLQIIDENDDKCMEELKILADLKYFNKIMMLSNTAYRYKFNQGHMYGTSTMGVYQRESGTIEPYEFIEI